MRSNYKKLGCYIQQVDIRNKDNKVNYLRGISSIYKELMPSKANIVGTDMSKYKIVQKGQFAFNPNTARMGDKIPIALNLGEPCIVSQIYPVFEIIDETKLLPEYLIMWFKREEFDRYARYKSHGSAREIFDWEEMCDVELPIPSIEKQREIVAEYYTITNRIKLNEQLNQKLEETTQAIYKEWFVDFNFSHNFSHSESSSLSMSKCDSESDIRPYKSGGGEMVYCKELEKEIPKGWGVIDLQKICTIKGGKRLPKNETLSKIKNEHPYIKIADMTDTKFISLSNDFEFVDDEVQKKISKYIVEKDDIIISIVGATIGIVNIIDESLDQANLTENCVKLTNLKNTTKDYLYHYFYSSFIRNEIEKRIVGGAQGKLPIYNIESMPILCPERNVVNLFSRLSLKINNLMKDKTLEIILLEQLLEIAFLRMATVEG
ncbi:restriction endonuclease subunit S [Francisella philomiragia]|uniref:restriction endonuclease subunit S n=1 Tax=Francisella philomiragia TaxID=28110 RepID=UPI001C9DBB1B|nr:restriction endonuclease subunit S [Francisella philomiragia]MBY7734830.1 restriction endonuclease subunit S [Francisella philomiragia]